MLASFRPLCFALALGLVACGEDVAGFPSADASSAPASTTVGGGDGETGDSGASDSGTSGGSGTSGDSASDGTGVDCPDGDADGDGVCDAQDPCPSDELDDSDGDGICDSEDQCASLLLDQNDGWLASPGNPFTDAGVAHGTISTWFRTTAPNGIVFSGEGYLQIALEAGFLLGCSDGVCTSATSLQSVNDGRWHHAAITWDAVHTALYLDGVFQQTIVPVRTPEVDSLDRPFVLGKHARQTVTETFDGEIAETAMWDQILTATQIQSLRDGVAGQAPPLLWWALDEGVGGLATDSGTAARHGTLQNGSTWSGTCPWADADLDGAVAYLDPDDDDATVP